MNSQSVKLTSATKLGDRCLAFLFLAVMATFLLGAGFMLGIEPRLKIDRDAERTFTVTGSNHIFGWQFFSKSIHGVTGVVQDNEDRGRRSDSVRERERQRRRKHLDFLGENDQQLSWARETDQRGIEEFMRGTESTLEFADTPTWWKLAGSYVATGLGALTLLGAFQSFFPKKPTV